MITSVSTSAYGTLILGVNELDQALGKPVYCKDDGLLEETAEVKCEVFLTAS